MRLTNCEETNGCVFMTYLFCTSRVDLSGSLHTKMRLIQLVNGLSLLCIELGPRPQLY